MAAEIEPRDTVRERPNTSPKTAAVPRPTGQARARITPKPVAADFPPVKFNHTERLWPKMAKSPANV